MDIAGKASELLSLHGKIAVVTGAGSGIGRGIAIRLAELGATIAVLDINSEAGKQVEAQIVGAGGKAMFIPCDVRSAEDCRRATEQTLDSFQCIHILCNNAGVTVRKDVATLREEEWDTVLDTTLKGVYLLSHEVIPHMIRNGGGTVINTGSGWSLKGGPRAAAYCAAKAGTLNLTRAMAIDYGPYNVRINCVCPGDVDTAMLAEECHQLGEDPERFRKEAANRPLRRLGTPDDVASAVLFFASDMSKWVTGSYLVVDGGGLA